MTQPLPPQSQDTRTEFQRQLDMARVEALFRGADDRSRLVVDLALIGLRSLVLINGAAIIAILTFLGHQEELAIRRDLWSGIAWLLWGLGSAFATNVLAYIAQQQFSLQEYSGAEKVFFNAYGDREAHVKEAEKAENVHSSWGLRLQIAALVTAILCFGCFAMGCKMTLDALIEANASPLF